MAALTCEEQAVSHFVGSELRIQPALGVLQAVALVDDQVVPPHPAEAACIPHQQLVAGHQQLEGGPLAPPHLQKSSCPFFDNSMPF